MTRNAFLTAASFLALSACLPLADEDDVTYLTEVLPDDRVLINMVTSDGANARSELGDWSELYVHTAEATDNVNGLIGGVLGTLNTVVNTRPSSFDRDAHRAVWGPYGDRLDAVDTYVVVQHHPDTDTHTWAFAQRPSNGSEGDEVIVIAGEIDAGSTRLDHTGRFAIDFTTMAELDPTVDFAGVFYSDYDVSPDGVIAEASVEGWEDLKHGEGPLDAVYSYAQISDGEGEMDLAWTGDHRGDGVEDVYLLRSRWMPDGSGRGDAVLAEDGGELIGAASECWDDGFKLVYRVDTWSGAEGDASACVYSEASYAE